MRRKRKRTMRKKKIKRPATYNSRNQHKSDQKKKNIKENRTV
jgi:hypothetical protein